MDAIGLALKMQRLTIWLEENCQPETLIRLQSGDGYLIIDPARQGDVASYNYNRVLLCGRQAAVDGLSVARWIDLFKAHGVKKFFVWLSPGPDMETVRGWLEAAGLSRVPWVRYPTLVRDGSAPVQFRTDPPSDTRRNRGGARAARQGAVAGICALGGEGGFFPLHGLRRRAPCGDRLARRL